VSKEIGTLNKDEPNWPKPAYSWTLLIFLMLAYVSSFIDRYILGLLIDPIKETTGASDTTMGFLAGIFNLTYALIALPAGLLVDRRSRTKIVAFGILLWSAATLWTGMAKNMVQLFLARMSVGVGEAVLSPKILSRFHFLFLVIWKHGSLFSFSSVFRGF